MLIIVSNDFPPERGGIQRMMSGIAKALFDHHIDVTVIAPSSPTSTEFDKRAPYRVRRYRHLQGYLGVAALLPIYLSELVRRRRKTTLAANWWPSGFAVALIPKLIRGKLLVCAHGSDVAPNRAGLRRAVMRFVYGRADSVLANSNRTEQLLADAGVARNVRCLTLGVELDRAREFRVDLQRSSEPRILSVGRLIPRKGFDRVIEAVAILATDFPSLHYVIVGVGRFRSDLVALASRLGVADRIDFLGEISDVQLSNEYATAWLFAMPARRIDDDIEGFGLVYLEAALAGLPSIGGRDSGAVDAIVDGETGVIVNGNDVKDIAAALRRLLRNPEQRLAMGQLGRSRALQHPWSRTASELIEIL